MARFIAFQIACEWRINLELLIHRRATPKTSLLPLFKNETRNIRADFYEAPFLTLQLIVEDQDTSSFPPREFNVHTDKLHATMGYYEFQDPTELDKLKARGLIYPASIPSSGYVDFVRRHYTTYPRGAIRP
jgi:hypothetical protein